MSMFVQDLMRRAALAAFSALFPFALAAAFLGGLPSATHAQGGTWTAKAPMPPGMTFGHIAVDDANGILYALGGGNSGNWADFHAFATYDPASDTWTPKPRLPTARITLGIGVVNSVVYAVGGQFDLQTLGFVEAYDPATNSWTPKASMPTPRNRGVVAVVNGILYAIGGCTDYACAGFVSTVEAYNPATNTWTTKAPMPTARRDMAATVVNGRIYVVGGMFGPGCSRTAAVEEYDPVTDTWASKALMPTPRSGFAAGAISGVLYAVGGNDCGITLQVAEAYDPASNVWSNVAPLPVGKSGSLTGSAVGGALYVVASWTGELDAFTAVITVAIDIKPGSFPNSINLGSAGVVPVAILSSATFDATQVDPATVTLAGAAVRLIGKGNRYSCGAQDVNGDGRLDLVCHVETAQVIIEPGDSLAVLEAKTFSGQSVRGQDSIQIVP